MFTEKCSPYRLGKFEILRPFMEMYSSITYFSRCHDTVRSMNIKSEENSSSSVFLGFSSTYVLPDSVASLTSMKLGTKMTSHFGASTSKDDSLPYWFY